MRHFSIALVTACLFGICASVPATEFVWQEKISLPKDRFVVIYVSDNCRYCEQMIADINNTPSMRRALTKFAGRKVHNITRRPLVGIKGTPTTVIYRLKPEVVAVHVGRMKRQEFVRWLAENGEK